MIVAKLSRLKSLLQLLAAVILLYDFWIYMKSKRWLNRKWYVRPINKRRKILGHFATIFQELKQDENLFFAYTRMDVNTFNYLLSILKPHLMPLKRKPDTIYPEQRLAVTLRYLASGDEILSIALDYRMGESTVYKIIKETCAVLYNVLSPSYLRPPSAPVWRNIAKGFEHDWNLPNCIGAVDGKHIAIRSPFNSGSLFFNYKKFNSIVFLACCNHRYEFMIVDVGAYGGESDGGVLARSEFGKALNDGCLKLPEESPTLPNTNIKFPYFFVGDEAFKLTKNFMRPYPGRKLDKEKRIFNYRLSRARRCIENAFGILSVRWRVLCKKISFQPEDVNKIVLATVCLHNFLMARTQKSVRKMYFSPELINTDNNGEEIVLDERDSSLQESNLTAQEVHALRNTLAKYFVSMQGEVPWQYDYINRGRYQE